MITCTIADTLHLVGIPLDPPISSHRSDLAAVLRDQFLRRSNFRHVFPRPDTVADFARFCSASVAASHRALAASLYPVADKVNARASDASVGGSVGAPVDADPSTARAGVHIDADADASSS